MKKCLLSMLITMVVASNGFSQATQGVVTPPSSIPGQASNHPTNTPPVTHPSSIPGQASNHPTNTPPVTPSSSIPGQASNHPTNTPPVTPSSSIPGQASNHPSSGPTIITPRGNWLGYFGPANNVFQHAYYFQFNPDGTVLVTDQRTNIKSKGTYSSGNNIIWGSFTDPTGVVISFTGQLRGLSFIGTWGLNGHTSGGGKFSITKN